MMSPSLLFPIFLILFTSPFVTSSTYIIDPSKPLGLPFDGIGALSAGASSRLLPDYPEPYRSHILDYLFLPSFGASLHILKVEIGGDAQSTEGTEASHMHVAGEESYERGYEWWLMKEAKARNPDIKLYGLSWGFPAFVMEGRKHGLPLTNTTVDYTVKWLVAARDVHNLTIDFCGIWNERAYSAEYILALHSALLSHGLSTLIVAADDCCPPWDICSDVLADDVLSAAVTYIGGHYPNQVTTANCSLVKQRKWSSEDFSSEYTAGGCWARLLNRNYVYGLFTATIAWSPIAAYYDELPYSRVGLMHAANPWSGHYDVDQVIWATAHTTHHTSIGWHYLAHGSGVGELTGGGTYVALTDGQGGLTIVVEAITHEQSKCINDGYAPGTAVKQDITFLLAGSFQSLPQLHVFYSSFDPSQPIIMYQYQGAIKPMNGSFTFTLQPDTIYTFSTSNSTKGTHQPPPPPAPFPTHYNDTFDTRTLYNQPRYLTDQSGTFEYYQPPSPTNHTAVIRQSAPSQPVTWCANAAMAYSLVGDHGWRYVAVGVDVLVEASGMAVVVGGVSTGGCTGVGGSAGVGFGVSSDGRWVLSNSTSLVHTVASGSGAYEAGVWYRLGLNVSRDGISVGVDGRVLAVVQTSDWVGSLTGWVGIGSSFDYVQFDNFEVIGSTAEQRVSGDQSAVQQVAEDVVWKDVDSSEHRHHID